MSDKPDRDMTGQNAPSGPDKDTPKDTRRPASEVGGQAAEDLTRRRPTGAPHDDNHDGVIDKPK